MSDGNRKLREFLDAPASVQDAFDARVDRAIRESLEAERAICDVAGDDPAWTQPPADPIGVKWDESWSKRAKFKPTPGQPEPYSRDTDPLLSIDLTEVWESLTGESVRGGISRCPNPDHSDRFPSCTVKAEFWRCHACDVGGTVIDLGAMVYGIEPRGRGFFDIRRRLLSELGMDERRAAA